MPPANKNANHSYSVLLCEDQSEYTTPSDVEDLDQPINQSTNRTKRSSQTSRFCSFLSIMFIILLICSLVAAVMLLLKSIDSPLNSILPSSMYGEINQSTKHSAPLFSLNQCRLKRAMSRFQSGEPSVLAALGGSITRHLNLDSGWLEMLTSRFNVRYPTLNGALKHRSLNLAKSATSSAFSSYCLSDIFDQNNQSMLSNVDVLFLEFGVNDMLWPSMRFDINDQQYHHDYDQSIEYSEAHVREFHPANNIERIIRYVLNTTSQSINQSLPIHGPAIVLVQFCFSTGASASRAHRPVAYYYGIPVVDLCELNMAYSDQDMKKRNLPVMSQFRLDPVHPNYAGHALAASIITSHLANLELSPHDHTLQNCQSFYSSTSSLPKALTHFNEKPREYKCWMGRFRPVDQTFQPTFMPASSEYEFPIVGSTHDWQYVDSYDTMKWGWETSVLNATLSFQLRNSTRDVILVHMSSIRNVGSIVAWTTGEPGGFVGEMSQIDGWRDGPSSSFESTALMKSSFPSRDQHVDELILHVQLLDVGAPSKPDNPTLKPANRFEITTIIEGT